MPFDGRPFDLAAEIGGSARLIEAIAGTSGKRVRLLQWPGDCRPFAAALQAVTETGLLNINGGDTRCDVEFPSLTRVAPLGFQRNGSIQIYASNSSEELYTDLWTSRYFGFRDLPETWDRTGAPRRLKPLNLYYHMYSGERRASLEALLGNLDALRKRGGFLPLGWLGAARHQPATAELVGLAAALSVTTPDPQRVATRLGAVIGRSGLTEPLHVLVQTYAERGRSDLSLAAGYALGDAMTARPDVALVLAQLEVEQGKAGAARDRLEVMARAGTMPPSGLAMLAELTLEAGDLPRAVSIFASLTSDQISEGLPRRMVEVLDAAGRADLLARLSVGRIADSSPASAASVALARGDRAGAVGLARMALARGGDPADFGTAFGRVVRSLELEHEAIARLCSIARSHPLGDGSLSLLIELAQNKPAELPALLETLLRQRDTDPRAAVVWTLLVARTGQSATVVSWLRRVAMQLPAQGLIDLLALAAERHEPTLARSVAAALFGRDLPPGWTQDEVALTLASNEPLTAIRLRKSLDLLGSAQTMRQPGIGSSGCC